jgi:hypothetical protein
MPTPAFVHDHSTERDKRVSEIEGKDYPYEDQMVWPGVATVAGLPATAAPIEISASGLPIGIQIVGLWLEDCTTIKSQHCSIASSAVSCRRRPSSSAGRSVRDVGFVADVLFPMWRLLRRAGPQ